MRGSAQREWMRAGEDALKAAMRLNKQEADIKEAMKAQREALGLD